jgi:hypothetical protein
MVISAVKYGRIDVIQASANEISLTVENSMKKFVFKEQKILHFILQCIYSMKILYSTKYNYT